MPKTAGVFRRIAAAAIDSLIGSLFFFVPIFGGIFGIFYILFKDAIMYRLTGYPEWQNKSIGKKLMSLKIVCQEKAIIDLETSARRNVILIPGRVIGIIPLLGWVLGPIVGGFFKLIELLVLTSDPQGIRLGDRLADTKVVEDTAKNI